jgi:hypothetical protein
VTRSSRRGRRRALLMYLRHTSSPRLATTGGSPTRTRRRTAGACSVVPVQLWSCAHHDACVTRVPLAYRTAFNEYQLCAEKRGKDDLTCLQRGRDYTSVCPEHWVSCGLSMAQKFLHESLCLTVVLCFCSRQVAKWKEDEDKGVSLSVGKGFVIEK